SAARPLPRCPQLAAERIDVARPHDEAEVALAQEAAQHRLGGGEVREPVDGAPMRCVGGRRGDKSAVDAGEVLRPLAGGVDVEDGDEVGAGEGRPELAVQTLGARVEVRLEDRDESARPQGAGSGDGGRNLGRVAGWSSSTLVTRAMAGWSLSIERSDSSASTTSHAPAPQPALAPVLRTSPPTT